MVDTKKRFFSSFAALNITQFFSALNDNVYKLLLVYLLITIKGPQHSNTILSLAGAVFVIPFLLLASFAGRLSDRLSKRSIICGTRLLELGIVALGVLFMGFGSAVGVYMVLFLMATQSALFSPSKYGIVPEIVKKEKISRCNGIMTASTYFAIILGTFLASFLAEVTHKNFVYSSLVCLLIAILGALSSLGIEKTKAQASNKKVSAPFVTDIYRTLIKAKKVHYLFIVIVFGAYFLFMGAYTQLNIIPFAMQSLHLSEIQGGYLFLMTAIGIGLGSFTAGRLAGDEVELGFIPLSAIVMSAAFAFLFFFQTHFYVVVPILMLLGFCGGFYVIPVDAFIQIASPKEDRGQNVAAGNFLNFVGVIIASGLLALLGNLLNLTAAQGFLVVGLLTFIMACFLIVLMLDQVLRLIVAKLASYFWDIKIYGRKQLLHAPPTLLVGQRTSWKDTVILMAALPRLVHYIIPITQPIKRYQRYLCRLLWLIPIDEKHFSEMGATIVEEIKKELQLGHSVCLMYPAHQHATSLKEWQSLHQQLVSEIQVPKLPVHISIHNKIVDTKFKEFLSLFKTPIRVSFGRREGFESKE